MKSLLCLIKSSLVFVLVESVQLYALFFKNKACPLIHYYTVIHMPMKSFNNINKTIMKKILSTVMLLVAAVGMQAQLLWKVTGNGLEKPSYIVGTYHLAPGTFADSIKGAKEAMNAAEQVYGEIVTADLANPEKLMAMQAAMMLPEGQTLDKLLDTDETGRLNAVLKELIGMDLTNPMVAQQLNKLSPQALLTQLTMLSYMKKTPNMDPTNTIDNYFQKEAMAKGKPTGGLETMEHQIDVLFKGYTLERQKELLMCFVDNREMNEKLTDMVTKGYFSQDLELLKEATDMKYNNSCDATQEEEDRLIYGRNAEWVKIMPGIMKDKSTLFAVGAAHLVGEKGVIELLKKAGYTVEGIK